MEPVDVPPSDLSSSAPPSDSSHVEVRRPRRRSTHPILLLLLIVVVTAAIAGGLWFGYYRATPVNNTETNLSAAGFNTPVVNKLDPRFVDADGDLLADAPSDPAQWIDPPTVVFSYVAVEDAEKYREDWKSFTDYLSKAIGKPVEYALLPSSDKQLKAMKEGRLHVAGFNTGSVPTAVNLTGFIPVCGIPTADGSALTHTAIIVPFDSEIQKPADLKNHELTFTEPASNSGYKAPVVLLRSNFGLQPLSDVLPRYSGSHDASIDGIAHKKYEAAAVAADMLAHALAAGTITPDHFRTIYTSESFPTAGLGYAYNLKPELAQKIRDALLSYNFKGTALEEKFPGVKEPKFVPVKYKDDWALIRRIDDEMGIQQKID